MMFFDSLTSSESILLILALVVGLYMAWNIGVNDVANAVGTSVGSGTLSLRQAVFLAACLEFSGAFFFGSHVSETIQNGIVDPQLFAPRPILLVYGMLSALIAAGVWLQLASYFGLPVSTTHSIVGALIGFAVVTHGWGAVNWHTMSWILSSWVLSPVLGGLFAYGIFNFLRRQIFYTQQPVKAAKAIAPWLVCGTIAVLTLFLLREGLSNLHLQLSFLQILLISVGVGIAGYLFAFLWVRRIGESQVEKRDLSYGPEIAVELDKAKAHLQLVQKSAASELHYSVTRLIDEIGSLSTTLRQVPVNQGSEYQNVEKIFGFLQVLSASLMAFAHGANDVANAIGPLSATVVILTTGSVIFPPTIPAWLLGLGGVGIVAGLATWGWRVIETIGKKLTELTPSRGFSAEFGAAATIVFASGLGLPISTTHTLVGAVIGVACARGIGALNLSTTRDIVICWIVTVPAGALIAIAFFTLLRAIFGG